MNTESFSHIDDILGAASGRFFAHGFRAASHELADLEIGVRHHHGFIRGRGLVQYREGGGLRALAPVSLSAIDAFVLAVELTEVYLATRFGLGPAERARMWIRHFSLKAQPGPVLKPGAFPVSAVHLGTQFESRTLCGNVSLLSCAVGGMTVRLEVEHEIAELRRTGGFLPDAEQILGSPGTRYYGERYKYPQQLIEHIEVDRDSVSATARVGLRVEEAAGPLAGMQGYYLPSITYVDALVIGTQLAQALLRLVAHLSPEDTARLRLREVTASSKTPHLGKPPFIASARLEQGRSATLNRGRWRAVDLVADFQAIHARFSVSHEIPGIAPATA